MYILNLEDNVFKQVDITKVIRQFGKHEVDWVRNLGDGIEKLEMQMQSDKPYDLIISDMWYPEFPGGSDANSGDKLVKIIKEKGWNVPIIICSSVDYSYHEIFGNVHYSKEEPWENELAALIRKLMQTKR